MRVHDATTSGPRLHRYAGTRAACPDHRRRRGPARHADRQPGAGNYTLLNGSGIRVLS